MVSEFGLVRSEFTFAFLLLGQSCFGKSLYKVMSKSNFRCKRETLSAGRNTVRWLLSRGATESISSVLLQALLQDKPRTDGWIQAAQRCCSVQRCRFQHRSVCLVHAEFTSESE